MAQCGICGMQMPKHPTVTENGKCSACNQKLEMKKEKKAEK
jgi:hypothetical protein